VAIGADAAYLITDADGNQTVFAVDLLTGRDQWSRSFPSSYGTCAMDQPSIMDDGSLLVSITQGGLYKLSKDGKMEVWKVMPQQTVTLHKP
jgi:outer membrane protein assembly factor BamB